MNEYDYTGDKMRNYFTAYLQKCIRWKRLNYLMRRKNISSIGKRLDKSVVVE